MRGCDGPSRDGEFSGMAGENGDDRDRAHRRVAVDAPVSIELDDSVKIDLEGIEQLAGLFTENISEGGLFIRTDFPLPIGTRFHVSVSLRSCDAILEADAEVAWTRAAGSKKPAGMGVRFLHIEPGDKAVITDLVDGTLPAKPKP